MWLDFLTAWRPQNGLTRVMSQGSKCKYPNKQAKTFITSYGPVSDVALYHPHCIYIG